MNFPKLNVNNQKFSTNCTVIIIYLFFTVISFGMLTVPAFSVKAPNEFIKIFQPDSTQIEVKIVGDEKINWLESKEGYTLLRNSQGFVVYATQNQNGDMIPSNERYENQPKSPNSKDFEAFINTVPKNLRYSPAQIETKLQVWQIKNNLIENSNNLIEKNNNLIKNSDKLQADEQLNIKGTRKYLVVLMQYRDKKFVRTREEIEAAFNQENYAGNAGIGSVRDYYIANSYSAFKPEFTVIGPFTAFENMAYYKEYERTRELVREAADIANDYINFADFDNTNDYYIDAINIIYAGYGQESGDANAIWPHAGTIANDELQAPMYRGKYLWRYCCSPELRGNSGSNINRIGVACHEFCHTLGSPDYYDTDYQTDGQYTGAGSWCLMANGSWNGGGACPANINIYQKYQFGWVEPEILSTVSKSVVDMPNSAENSVAYVINTATSGEFFIMENKQRVGFDANIPGHGLLIWHIHADISDYYCLNCSHPQKMYPVCASSDADINEGNPSAYGRIESSGCPFPGSSGNTEFTDNSMPSAKSWSNSRTLRPITNIAENNSLISFNYTGRPDFAATVPYNYNFTSSQHFNYYTVIRNDNFRYWQRKQDKNTGNWYADIVDYGASKPANDWLITPAIAFETGNIYTLKFFVKAGRFDKPESLQIFLGTSNSNIAEMQTLKLLDLPAITNLEFSDTAITFQVPYSGFFYVGFYCNSAQNNRYVLSLDEISITGVVGIAAKNPALINIFPNPTKEQIIIENNSNEIIEKIEITNISGEILLTVAGNINKIDTGNIDEIDISALEIGTYFVIIHSKNSIIQSQKIIKN